MAAPKQSTGSEEGPAITVTQKNVSDIFESWLRDFNDNPDQYEDEYGEPESYGDSCSEHFFRLASEQGVS